MKEFKDLISPVALNTFVNEFWCKKAFFLKGHKEKYNSIFNWEKLNNILNSNNSPHPSVFIAKEGAKEIPKNQQDLITAIQNGGTMIVEDVDRFDNTLSSFLNQISNEFIHNSRFNLYLSYPGKAGYLTHYDTHDVFILQIKGAKKWRVFPSTIENPIFFQKTHGIIKPSDETIYINTVLEEGDFLYIPRGHWHDAIATDDLSLHLTLAIFPRTGIYFMNWLADELTENSKFRQNFPLVFPENREDVVLPVFKNHIDNLKRELINIIESADLTDNFYDFVVSTIKDRPRISLPHISTINNETDILNFKLYRPSKLFRVKKQLDKTTLINGNKKLSFPPDCNSLIDFIFSNEKFDFKDLQKTTTLDKEDIVRITKVLIKESILLVNE